MLNSKIFRQYLCTQVYQSCQKHMPQIKKIPVNAWQRINKGSTNQLWYYQNKVLRINTEDKYLVGVNRQLEKAYLDQLQLFDWAPKVLAYAPKSACLPAGAYLMPLYQETKKNEIEEDFFINLLKTLADIKPIES